MSDKFEYALNSVFGSEGGQSNDKNDHGGETNLGVIQNDIDEYNKRAIVKILKTPSQLTTAEATLILKMLYWDDLLLDSVNDPDLSLHIFDSAVLQGTVRTVKWVQQILNSLEPGVPNFLKDDGLMGMQTLFKINNLQSFNKPRFIDGLIAERKRAFNWACLIDWTQKDFRNGWYNRVNRLPGVQK